MSLYADENVPLRVVEELRRLGVDVLTAFEDGRANQSLTDQVILARAIELGRTIVTLNRRDSKDYTSKRLIMQELSSAKKIPIVFIRRKLSFNRWLT